MFHTIMIIIIGIFVHGCVSHSSYIADYTDTPQAQAACSDSQTGAAPDKMTPTDRQACLTQWANEQAMARAQNINDCITFTLAWMLVPLTPLCYLEK